MHPSCMCGVWADSASQCFGFLNYKMGHPFPSHKAIVEIIAITVPAPSCLKFSLPEVFFSSLSGYSYSSFRKSGCNVTSSRKPCLVTGSYVSLSLGLIFPIKMVSSVRVGAVPP